MRGDLSGLSPDEKVQYYKFRCTQLEIDPAEQPFQLLRLNGRELLYATKSCTDALCRSRQLKREITSRERIEDVYVVTCRCSDQNGRFDEATGAVNINALKGDMLANALMKAETKAKRRAVLSLCGLGMLDETELETVPGVVMVAQPELEAQEIEPGHKRFEGAASEQVEAKSAVPASTVNPGQGLSPKRSAWLLRVGIESKVPHEILERCMTHLKKSSESEINLFFDGLAKRKGAAFNSFNPCQQSGS
jgi:hypothetical protein